jgi:hypothetical protein
VRPSADELPWRPFAFAQGAGLTWETTPSGTLRATFDDSRTQASVTFDVDEEGRVLRARASDRPRLVGKSVVDTVWSGTFDEYVMFESLRVPRRGEVTWHLPDGPFTYWRAQITELRLVR